MIRYILKCHTTKQICYMLGEAVSIATTASGKRNILLPVEITPLTFIALHLHAYGYTLATYGKSDKVPQAIPILHNKSGHHKKDNSLFALLLAHVK